MSSTNPFDDRTPKEDPGDGLPTKTPDEIEFKWDKTMVEKKSCDTLHMLYLLQLALDLVRRRTIERNKYFKSIGRTDRYINQLDNPQIITNFLDGREALHDQRDDLRARWRQEGPGDQDLHEA